MSHPVAIVTGGSRRIGLAIVERLVGEGFAVLVHASPHSEAEAREVARRLAAGGARAAAVAADLAAPEPAGPILAAARSLGRPHLLVNNASLFENDAIESFDPALFDAHMAVNLRAPLALASAFAAEAEAGACVINLLDQRVKRLNPLYLSYTLSKSALWTATRTLAQALAPRGIRVNGVAPGPVLPNSHHGEEAFRREVDGLPLRRAVPPAEIADAVLFLARAESVTGQLVAVDSGQHLGWETPDILGYDVPSRSEERS